MINCYQLLWVFDVRKMPEYIKNKTILGGINTMDAKKTISNIEVLNSRDNSAIVKAYHDRLMEVVEDMTEETMEPEQEDGS